MEFNGVVVYVEDDKAMIIMFIQVVNLIWKEVVDWFGLVLEDVNIIFMYFGGGFGCCLYMFNVVQVVVFLKVVGKFVKCFFNCWEEF